MNNYQLFVASHLSYVEHAPTYEDIVANLKWLFVKKQNNVYVCHLLVSHHQKPGESISEFAQALELLAKDCSFADISAGVYRDELSRDSFINGLSSTDIRQRLLEKEDLNFLQVPDLTDSSDKAHRQSLTMVQPLPFC